MCYAYQMFTSPQTFQQCLNPCADLPKSVLRKSFLTWNQLSHFSSKTKLFEL